MAPRKRSTKKTKSVKEKKQEKKDPFEGNVLFGELFWEYRAKTAEWEKAFLDSCLASKACTEEKKDPKYAPLLELMQEEERALKEVKQRGTVLKAVQERVAKRLGISLEDFLAKCVIDFDTGIVRLLD